MHMNCTKFLKKDLSRASSHGVFKFFMVKLFYFSDVVVTVGG